MNKGIKRTFLTLITLLLLVTFTATAWASQPVFKDVTGNHWARPSVEEMNAAGVIAGHSDGTFKPSDPVTLYHTIVMLARINNLVAHVESYNLNNSNYEFPPGSSDTVKKYLAVAADKNWLNPAGLKLMNPNNPATRQEVAIILAAALNLRGNADNLPFADKNKISASHQVFIAGIYEAGIMRGRTATDFDPQSNVMRSELATIFSRITEQGRVDPSPDRRVVGYIQQYNSTNNQITVSRGSGLPTVYTLASNTPVYNVERLAALSTIPSNQLVRIYLDQSNRVTFVRTTTGTPSAPSNNNDNTTTPTKTEYWGYVRDLTVSNITVQLDEGNSINLQLSNTVRVYDENDNRVSLLDLTRDTYVKVELSSNQVQNIYIRKPSSITTGELGGTVYRLTNDRNDQRNWRITIRHFDGERKEYNVTENVMVYDADGKRINFWQLNRDDQDTVILSLDRRGNVEIIQLADSYLGNITYLDDREIKIDRRAIDLPRRFDISNYIIGSKVLAYVHDRELKLIEVLDEENYTAPGKISSVSERNREITINQDSGNSITFDVHRRVEIRDRVDQRDLSLDDLRRNWEVRLDIENSVVVRIYIDKK